MLRKIFFIILLSVFLVPLNVMAKKVQYRKTQEVNFEEANIDGTVRSPDGAYLHQKRGMQFEPLYKVREQFDKGIKESVDYLR